MRHHARAFLRRHPKFIAASLFFLAGATVPSSSNLLAGVAAVAGFGVGVVLTLWTQPSPHRVRSALNHLESLRQPITAPLSVTMIGVGDDNADNYRISASLDPTLIPPAKAVTALRQVADDMAFQYDVSTVSLV